MAAGARIGKKQAKAVRIGGGDGIEASAPRRYMAAAIWQYALWSMISHAGKLTVFSVRKR